MNLPVATAFQEQSRPGSTSGFKQIFFGPDGLRVIWRLLIFAVLTVALLAACLLIRNGGVQGFLEAKKHSGEVTPTPFMVANAEFWALGLLCLSTWIMAKIEHRRFGVYGLSWSRAFKKEFWVGAALGFGMISGTLLVMFLCGVFRINGLAVHGTTLLTSVAAWLVAFLLAGFFEEFLLRGYLQFTLSEGIGFWPGAIVLSVLFAYGHSFNANETPVGVIATGLFGLLLCLFLRRTGNIWAAVGFHLGYDWGQTFYGVPDSGMVTYHSTLSSSFHGPVWLTGGIVGPEASVLTPIALLATALVFSYFYRDKVAPRAA
ncbi:MAG TPA: CPBP family intramembrane glutamic endopeptidase [Terriglobales bacterium]